MKIFFEVCIWVFVLLGAAKCVYLLEQRTETDHEKFLECQSRGMDYYRSFASEGICLPKEYTLHD